MTTPHTIKRSFLPFAAMTPAEQIEHLVTMHLVAWPVCKPFYETDAETAFRLHDRGFGLPHTHHKPLPVVRSSATGALVTDPGVIAYVRAVVQRMKREEVTQ